MAVVNTHPLFWDCECETDYIHLKDERRICPHCSTKHEEQPDSRANEVKELIYDELLESLRAITERGNIDRYGFAASSRLMDAQDEARRAIRALKWAESFAQAEPEFQL